MQNREDFDWVGGLPETVKQDIYKHMKECSVRAGQTIYSVDQSTNITYRIKSGQVRSYLIDEAGTESLIKIYRKNECLGGLGMFDDKNTPVYATAETNCVIQTLSRQDYYKLRDIHPIIEREQLRFFAQMLRRVLIFYHEATSYPLPSRIASRLSWLNESNHCSEPEYDNLTISHYDLAAMVGASRPAVSKVLSCFKERGIIETQYGKITILNQDLLQREVRYCH